MKTASGFIWQLIHAMNSQEKIFFKRRFAGSGQASTQLYMRLFDAIARQKEYNEKALLDKFNPAITRKNIAYQKHYLQKQVCAALIEYEALKTPGQGLYENLQLIRIYRQKGLFDEAFDRWKKTVVQARSQEAFAMLNLLKSEFEKMVIISPTQTGYDDLLGVFLQNIISYQEYSDLITLRDIYTETLLLKKKTHLNAEPAHHEQLKKLMAQVNNADTARHGHSFLMRHYYYMSKATLLYLMNDMAGSMALLKDRMEDWQHHKAFLQSHGEFYIELLYMINYAGVLEGDFGFVEAVFNSPFNRQLTDATHIAYMEVIRFLALNKVYNKTARYSDVHKLLQLAKQKYSSWEPRLNAELSSTLHFSMGLGCFVLEEYSDALFHTHQAITHHPESIIEEYAAVSYLFLLLITYCMDNDRLFESQYRNTYTYFYKRKKKQPFEKTIIQCLHRSFSYTDHKKKQAEYQKALEQLAQTADNLVQKRAFAVFNFPGWFNSRLRRVSYRQYVEQQVICR